MKRLFYNQTKLISSINNFYPLVLKRFMVSRANLVTKKGITTTDAEQIARSVLGFCKTITNQEIVSELGLSSKDNIATPYVTQKVLFYIKDKDNLGGTATIKTNFLASFVNQNKQMTYKYVEIGKTLDSKIKIHDSLLDKTAPVRTLLEYPIIECFINRFSQIKNAVILGDNIPIPNRTKNINRDLLVEFQNNLKKDFDVKTSNFDDKIHYGDLREIAINSSEKIITYPRNFENFHVQYKLVLKHLQTDTVKKALLETDRKCYDIEVNKLQTILTDKPFSLQNHQTIENAMMNINSLPSFNSNLNFNNIYLIKNGDLTLEEIKFIQEAVKYVHPSLLDKPSYMQKYLVDSLHLYNKIIDKKTAYTLKPLVKTYPFIKEFLKDNYDIFV